MFVSVILSVKSLDLILKMYTGALVCDARIKQFIVPYMPIFLAALLIGASPNLYARGIFAEWQTLSRFFGPSSTKDQRRR